MAESEPVVARREEFKGYWWLPEKPENQWFGDFKWQPELSPELTLYRKTADEHFPPEGAEAFFGLDEHGRPLTLLRAGSSRRSSSSFLSEHEYHAGHLLRGIHVHSLTAFHANEVSFWLQHLSAWFSQEGFEESNVDGFWQVKYRRPDDRSFSISKNVTMKLCHSAQYSSGHRRRTIRDNIYILIEKQRPFTFDKALRWINSFRALLHFATLRAIYSPKITFRKEDITFQIGKEPFRKEIELLSGCIYSDETKPLLPDDFVFTFSDVEARFTQLLSNWMRFGVEYREAMDCYMSTIYANLVDNLRLISITQALEAFDERRYKPVGDDGNFVNRIRRLCAKFKDRLMPIVGDLNQFAEAVRDSRNYYTHHDPAIMQKGKVFKGRKLLMATFHLVFLFRLCVLSEFDLERDPYSLLKRQLPFRITEFYGEE